MFYGKKIINLRSGQKCDISTFFFNAAKHSQFGNIQLVFKGSYLNRDHFKNKVLGLPETCQELEHWDFLASGSNASWLLLLALRKKLLQITSARWR